MQLVDQKLPIDIKQKWIAALRSGEYMQGIGKLYESGRYCCLGVLAAICGNSNKVLGKHLVLKDGMSGVPDLLIGPSSSNPIVDLLTTMNGITGKSFDQIAGWIEENL
jgi:hypothetical protein